MNALELTSRLISIPSISGDERAVAEFLGDYLSHAGFEVDLPDAEPGRPNVYARMGNPDVVLSSHIDTVPPYVEFREDEDFIYGRGACDAKGIIAAMIEAAEQIAAAGVKDFGLLFVVGEESGSAGARAANTIPNRSRFLINGEPTQSRLALGSKGSLKVTVKTSGRAAHSAYPEIGESAIEKLLDVLEDFRRAPLPIHEALGEGTMNIGMIRGGVAHNVIPPAAEADLMFRIVTDTRSIKDIIRTITAGRAEVSYIFECEPVFMEKIAGFDTDVVRFTTDIPLLTNWGKPLLFGPGSILDAHTPHEKISKLELAHAVGAYSEMVVRLKEMLSAES
ncbi:MAG: peptidase dimerization protein [Blastocatellia bacterium AA13]|nr:MAG: peptidase dimerization protein [Blastocatellia bacterium AA13]